MPKLKTGSALLILTFISKTLAVSLLMQDSITSISLNIETKLRHHSVWVSDKSGNWTLDARTPEPSPARVQPESSPSHPRRRLKNLRKAEEGACKALLCCYGTCKC
ncbi:hypothetical protein SRHO_G00000570 [Serrasalmus rhombeus]